MANMANCPYCGKLTDLNLDNCPHCGGYMQKKQAAAAPKAGDQRQTCPSCHALVQDGDIICVACGTNLLTGQKVTEERGKLAPRERVRLPIWMIVGVAAVLVALLLVAAYTLFLAQADPVQEAIELSAAGRLLDATELLQKYVSSHPDSAEAHFELGKLYWKTSQYPKAAASFQEVTQLDSKNLEAALLNVLSLASTGGRTPRNQEIAALKQVVDRFPDNETAWRLLGLAQGANGDFAGSFPLLG